MSYGIRYKVVPKGTAPKTCKCGALIYMVPQLSGKTAPIHCDAKAEGSDEKDPRCVHPTATENGIGIIHFADCPAWRDFKKPKPRPQEDLL